MKILIGVCMGMLLGGGGVWAFHDPRPLERYDGVVNPLALPEVKSVQRQHTSEIKRERPQETPCQR
ncbi:MAG TPA: hypothetical protein VGJ57_05145 [Nitrospirales bacterium]|jgi:hypothetical protein